MFRFPGVVYYLTFWYPRHELQLRVGLFFGAATIVSSWMNVAWSVPLMVALFRLARSPAFWRTELASWTALEVSKDGLGFLYV